MNDLVEKLHHRFRKTFGEEPLMVRSPGRINLIGEHTDYNEGFVLPAAVDKAIYFAVAPRSDHHCHLVAMDLEASFQFGLSDLEPSPRGWPNYIMGVVDQLQKAGGRLWGFNCMFGGDIPIAAGLASSAAIEAGLAFALNELFQLGFSLSEIARMAMQAENEFVGVQCGIMDQLANVYGRADRFIHLDCRSLDFDYVPFSDQPAEIVLCDTQISRELSASEYNLRRRQCEEGVRFFQQFFTTVHSLRDVTLDMLESYRQRMDPVIYQRCLYVLQENDRVMGAVRDLRNGDLESLGIRLLESHMGLRDMFEVSCPSLDALVEAASRVEGVYGARMMGAGFGGCTINLVHPDALPVFQQTMSDTFQKRLKKPPLLYRVKIEEGTSVISM
ncbi:MAG: galactokinase [Calditrichaeota bacterium]|nr:galactokinase [Calditrichota bacterium]